MEKNYYEILEVNPKASKEVIDKVYKMLAKKYHPDLQKSKNREYEEKMKLINEAYSVLSDDDKRKEYDNKLQSATITLEQYQILLQENRRLKQEIQKLSGIQMEEIHNHNMYNQQYEEQINRAVNQAYQDAYVQDLKNRGYKIRYKRTFKQYMKMAVTILCIILICFLVYQIPFVKRFFTNIYNENILIKTVVDIFVDTFTTKF